MFCRPSDLAVITHDRDTKELTSDFSRIGINDTYDFVADSPAVVIDVLDQGERGVSRSDDHCAIHKSAVICHN